MASFEDHIIIFYSLALFGVALALLCYRFRPKLRALGAFFRKPLLRHLSYQPVVHSQRFKVQWSRADVLAEVAYVGVNVFLVCFRIPSFAAAGRRAANICIVNLIFLCAVPHLDALTNTLGLRLRTVRRLHGSVGIMTGLLLIFHIVVFAFSQVPFPLADAENKWAIVVSLVRRLWAGHRQLIMAFQGSSVHR